MTIVIDLYEKRDFIAYLLKYSNKSDKVIWWLEGTEAWEGCWFYLRELCNCDWSYEACDDPRQSLLPNISSDYQNQHPGRSTFASFR